MANVKLLIHFLINHLFKLCVLPLMAFVAIKASSLNQEDVRNLYLHLQNNLLTIIILSVVLAFGSTIYFVTLLDRFISLTTPAISRPHTKDQCPKNHR